MKKLLANLLKFLGLVIGLTLGRLALNKLAKMVNKNFTIKIKNQIQKPQASYLLVANHTQPKEAWAQGGIAPDAFVLQKIIKQKFHQDLKIMAKCDDGWWSKNKLYYFIQKYLTRPLGLGMSLGAGLIPIQKNPGSTNLFMFKMIETCISKNQPILIFPEGVWKQENELRPLKQGFALLAIKYNLPVLPVYLTGATSWKKSSVRIAIGEMIQPNTNRDILTQQTTTALNNLKAVLEN